jgi:hypothetical protein
MKWVKTAEMCRSQMLGKGEEGKSWRRRRHPWFCYIVPLRRPTPHPRCIIPSVPVVAVSYAATSDTYLGQIMKMVLQRQLPAGHNLC